MKAEVFCGLDCVDVVAEVFCGSKKHDSKNMCARLLSFHVCSVFACIDGTLERLYRSCVFVLSRQRLLRAHVEVSEVTEPGPRFVGERAEGEREGGLCRVTDP